MSTPDPEMVYRGRLGALVMHSRYDGAATTAKARATFIASFTEKARKEALAKGEAISEAEAERRGEFLRRAHYTRLAYRSMQARASRASAWAKVAAKDATADGGRQ
jgi:hypothetical protein